MYTALVCLTREMSPGLIRRASEAAESTLNRNGQLSPPSVRLVNLDPSLVLSPSLSLASGPIHSLVWL